MITRGQSLPCLARRLSDDGARACRWMLVLAIALGVVGAAVWIAVAEGLFASTEEVLGWPLVAIGERGPANIAGWEAAAGEEPRGWISIGRRPVGFFAFGFQPTGVIAIGNIPVGVVAIGHLAVGVLPIGITAVGLASLGVASGGWLSFGVGSVGRYAYGSPLGGVSLGAYAWGQKAYGVYLAHSHGAQKPAPVEKLLFAGGTASMHEEPSVGPLAGERGARGSPQESA